MGIVNVTPDSFSDGGHFFHWEKAVEHGLRLLAGETDTVLSVDTRRPAVAAAALDAGARWINDVTGMRDPELLALAAEREVGVCIMHMQGEPKTIQRDPRYENVVAEVSHFLDVQARAARDAGVAADRIWVDPGIGFGKTLAHNLALMAALDRIAALGYPVLLGASRKRFIEKLTGDAVDQRLGGSLAAAGCALDVLPSVVRVHDVRATRQYLLVRDAIRQVRGPRPS